MPTEPKISDPRVLVLTSAKPDEPAREFFTDRERFPLEAATTTDLAKARIWNHYIGAHRFLARHPELKTFNLRRLPASTLTTARAADVAAGAAPAAAAAKPARSSTAKAPGRAVKSSRRTKTDPNKRKGRATRVKAVREARRRLGKPRRASAAARGVSKPSPAAKVA
jgi:hypothetical protein